MRHGLEWSAHRAPEARLLDAELDAERDAPGHARRLVRSTLMERGYDEAFSDDVTLVVGELANNAVLHAQSRFSVAIRATKSRLRVAVHDEVPPATTARGEQLVAQPMHGLGMIAALSTRWGVEGTDKGKVVWAELSCEPPLTGAPIDDN